MGSIGSTQTRAAHSKVVMTVVMTVLTSGIGGLFISAIYTGNFDMAIGAQVMGVYLLPVIGFALSKIGIFGQFPLWVWYFAVLSWISVTFTYWTVIKHLAGRLTKEDLSKRVPMGVFTLIWFGISGITSFAMGSFLSFELSKTIGFLYVISNPLTFPIALLTDLSAFSFNPEVWVVIVIGWLVWYKGLNFTSKVYQKMERRNRFRSARA